jgi:chemotaxis protein methyltransferase CheR
LIERNRRTRSLRIWSAGCSTGEEAYSLAILVHELVGTRSDWDVVIVGTDVNKHAIAGARRGIYREHSLRALDQNLRRRYFHQHRDCWELDARFRSMVSFRQVNLLKDPFPDLTANLSDIDLILCRNVFIYFDRAAVARVLMKLTNTLRVGGYLVTGHAELHDQQPSGLRVKAFSESVIYQREGARAQDPEPRTSRTHTANMPSMAPKFIRQSTALPIKPLASAQAQTPRPPVGHASGTAMRPAVDDSCQAPPSSTEDIYRQAQGYADVGNYEAARRCCQLALAKDSLAEKPYYLLAQIAEVQGDIATAKDFLKKVLYLSPEAITAHLELGALYAREHDLPRAWKMLNLALELLKTMPPDAVIEPFADLPAAQLLPEVQRRIAQLGHPS